MPPENSTIEQIEAQCGDRESISMTMEDGVTSATIRRNVEEDEVALIISDTGDADAPSAVFINHEIAELMAFLNRRLPHLDY